jgi:hypothetical protein
MPVSGVHNDDFSSGFRLPEPDEIDIDKINEYLYEAQILLQADHVNRFEERSRELDESFFKGKMEFARLHKGLGPLLIALGKGACHLTKLGTLTRPSNWLTEKITKVADIGEQGVNTIQQLFDGAMTAKRVEINTYADNFKSHADQERQKFQRYVQNQDDLERKREQAIRQKQELMNTMAR